jgi:tetratricopeptide (TPR) repeat protein
MWCILGDLIQDPECYEKAWLFSCQNYSRAQRSLGNYYLHKEQFEKAAFHYKLAVSVNSLFPDTWFALGCSYMRLEEWQKALEAFSFMIHISSEVRFISIY